jgi:LysM repeat protein
MNSLKKLVAWLEGEGYKKEAHLVCGLIKVSSNPKTHTVESGDSLGKIAEIYDIDLEALKAANDLDHDRINIGQELIIPDSERSFVYTIKSGDTLLAIAEDNGVSISDILEKNEHSGLKESSTLSIGQEIRIPYATSIEQKRREAEDKHIRKWSGSDDDLLAMTLLGEGGTFLDTGEATMREVLTVILNRMKYMGGSLKDIVFAPGQFEFWMKHDPQDVFSGEDWGEGHPRWDLAMSIGKSRRLDPRVAYSTHYWNPRLVRPSWRKKILVVHESKHVYGVLPDGSQLFRKVERDHGESIKKLEKYSGS